MRSAVTIGVFDGVHRGHRALLRRARSIADQHGLPLVVLTFDPHPMAVVRPEATPCLLTELPLRRRLLLEAGANTVEVLEFDSAVSHWSPARFADEILVRRLGAAHVVVGANFRFGHRASGEVAQLTQLGAELGFTADPVDLAADPEGAVWSSSRVRTLIAAGDVAAAAEGLERPHRMIGPVVRGDQRGRGLGFPTANVAVSSAVCRPADGVYAARLLVPWEGSGDVLPAAVSVGANATFGGHEPRVEAHVIGTEDLDLYDRDVAVDFVARLRDMTAFDSVAELTAQMGADVAAAAAILR